jgi:hypothetical protein
MIPRRTLGGSFEKDICLCVSLMRRGSNNAREDEAFMSDGNSSSYTSFPWRDDEPSDNSSYTSFPSRERGKNMSASDLISMNPDRHSYLYKRNE